MLVPTTLALGDNRVYVRDQDLQAIARLWRELSDFPAGQFDSALAHCLRELARMLGATNVLWVGAVREPGHPASDELHGWRPKALKYLHFDEARQRPVTALLRSLHANDIDPMTQANVELAGTTRAMLRRQLVADDVWRKSWLYNEVLHPLGVEDRLMGTHTVDADHESYFAVDRGPDDLPFEERERDVLELFLNGIPAFHRELLQSYGLYDASTALSPREREVLRLLLTDKSERAIAADLGLAESTVHQYVVSILHAFGVRRRIGLMARWLNNSPACLVTPYETVE